MTLQAGMVVLSASETALGQKMSGEGIMGLSWALFAAGCRIIVAAHWQVNDASTRNLIVRIYRGILAPGPDRITRASALRRTQLALARSPQYSHPYY